MDNKKLDNLILDINGKDDRLDILDDGITKYGCHTKPYPHISYSSCTASTISLEAYTHVDDYITNNLNIDIENRYVDEFQMIRDKLRSVLGLEDTTDICLGASGTDLEMLPYTFIPKGSNVCNIVIGPDEIGSGTLLAAEGCMFSNVDSGKFELQKGKKLEGFEEFNIRVHTVPIRDNEGVPVQEKYILEQIAAVLKSNENTNTYTIVHSVFHSKTGLIKPLPDNLINLVKGIKNTIVVIDACQLRISRETISDLLKKGCIVFITGSKFFAAPTFSAAALIPDTLRDNAAKNTWLPSGLNFLFAKELFPKRWKSVEEFEYGQSLGLLLRWKATIFEMQLFNSISKERIIKTINIFNKCVEKIEKKYPTIVIYSDIKQKENEPYDFLMSKTILTFGFTDLDINFEKSQEIYKELIGTSWLNEKFPYSIHLGQPVKVRKHANKWLGTLRIALSSKFFVNYSGKVEAIQQDTVLSELEYIFDALTIIIKKTRIMNESLYI